MSADRDSATGPIPASLTSAQLLDGLRLKLATQIAPLRWRLPLRKLTDRVQSGVPLEEAVRQSSLPAELRITLQEGLKLPEPTQFVLEMLRARDQLQRNWGNFKAAIAYPLLLLLIAVGGGLLLSFELKGLFVSSIGELFDMFDSQVMKSALDQHQANVGAAMVVGWSTLILFMLRWIGPSWAWTAVVGSFTLIGRPLRWIKLQEILLRYKIMVQQGVPDGQLASAVARSFAASSQSFATQHVAQRVQAGMPLGAALSSTMLSDGLCQPALLLLDSTDSRFADACDKVANLIGEMTRRRLQLLTTLMPIFVLLLVGSVLWSTLSMYLHILMLTMQVISAFA